MIVDTSALVAIALREADRAVLLKAIMTEAALIPAPVIVEFYRVITKRGREPNPVADELLEAVFAEGATIESLVGNDGLLAAEANLTHGLGNGRGGTLNFGDLMVYAVAKRLNMPVLCTGRDFAATGIAIHPASRVS